MPVIHIPYNIYNAIISHGEAAYPQEACGLLAGFYKEKDIIITSHSVSLNLADNPQTEFRIDPVTHIGMQKTARITGRPIIGVYHSHPDGKAIFSSSDKKNAIIPNFLWLIIAIQQKKKEDIRCYITSPKGKSFLDASLKIVA